LPAVRSGKERNVVAEKYTHCFALFLIGCLWGGDSIYTNNRFGFTGNNPYCASQRDAIGHGRADANGR
jgi:hypothetical protein